MTSKGTWVAQAQAFLDATPAAVGGVSIAFAVSFTMKFPHSMVDFHGDEFKECLEVVELLREMMRHHIMSVYPTLNGERNTDVIHPHTAR